MGSHIQHLRLFSGSVVGKSGTTGSPIICTAVLILLISVMSPLSVAADENQVNPAHHTGELYLRTNLGYALQDLASINNQIDNDDDVQEIRAATEPDFPEEIFHYNHFSNAKVFGLELGGFVSPVLSFGLGLSYRQCQVDNHTRDPYYTIGDGITLKTTSISTVATWYPSFAPALNVGCNLGVVFGSYQRDISYHFSLQPEYNTSLYGNYKGEALMWGFFAGYEHQISSVVHLQTRIGYSRLNLDEYTGTTDRVDYGRYSGTLTDSRGQAVKIDFSGFYTSIGINFSFLLPAYMR